MKNNQKLLITFDELSVELSKAIKKNDYNSVRMVAEKQNDFMQRVKGIMTNNFDTNPAKGGTPASDIIKINIETARNGSLLAKPPKEDSLEPPPSDSRTERTRKAPNLNATRTIRWNITAARTTTAASPGSPDKFSSQFHAPIAVIAASIYPA